MATEPIAPQAHGRPPARELLMTASSYEAAVEAVDALAAVEDITGRYGWTRALGSGALTGGLIGVLFGLLFDWWGALTPSTGWGWLAFWGLIYGAVIGGLMGLILYASSGG